MKNKLSILITILLCLIVLGVFWHIKDLKETSLNNGQVTSNIETLRDNEIGSNALGLQEAFVKVSERLKPAVVNISTVQMLDDAQQEFYFGDPFEDFFQDFFNSPQEQKKQRKKSSQYRTESGGTGVIIDPEGYILTNEHVIHGANEIKVTVTINSKDKTYTGKVIGKDSRTDLAIVKINSNSATEKFPAAPLGDSNKIRVGEIVLAIGSPFGLGQTVTNGIISAIRQSIVVENKEYRDFIQTDAPINRGNSGGPLCNIHGEVIGINTAIYAPTGVFSGIGFAIPINRAKEILADLIRQGKVVRGWLGVEIKDKSGAFINSIIKDSPAEKAGLKKGDVIIEFNGKQIESVRNLQAIVSDTGPKKKIKVKFVRNGKENIVDLV
ncbi:MAG: trypsin-like peptidase domain-containing protein, partial [Elusimicrobiota bacterium]